MSATHSPHLDGSLPKFTSPAAILAFLTASALSMNHLAWRRGSCRYAGYVPVAQILTRIWKKPAESASPPLRFLTPDSTSEAMTGSSGGRPAAFASDASHFARSACEALSPG